MPYFREAWEDCFDVPETPAEKMETARWLWWCGWDKEAGKILRSVADGIEAEHDKLREKESQTSGKE